MALFIDKYRPRDIQEFDYHAERARQLIKFVELGDFPHLLFCGPSGAGKRTLIQCLLNAIYGKGVENVHLEVHDFQTNSGKKLQVNIISSNYHIELTPSDVGIYDRIVVQEIIKDAASVQQLNRSTQKSFKVIILNEAENLTKDAQHALRRTMEKYASLCKIILCCDSSSRIIDPLRSRCMVIRVPAPTDDELCLCIKRVCNCELINLSENWLKMLLKKSDGDARKALCLLEASVSQHGNHLDKQPLIEPEWEMYLRDTAKIILQNLNSNGTIKARERFYEMLSRCIPASVIFRNLAEYLLQISDHSLIKDILSSAATFEHSSRLGSKEIFHLEAFVATVIDSVSSAKQKSQ